MPHTHRIATPWPYAPRLHHAPLTTRIHWLCATRAGDAAKRALDVSVATAALIVLSPVAALIALLIKCSDGGPVLYWHPRVGRHGRLFAFPKFRSMHLNADRAQAQLAQTNQHGAQGVTFKMQHDPRVTRIGKWLRRTSLDELPQLMCVIRGDMSLVGPRPALPQEVARYTPQQARRLAVTPGLTCLWQVQGRSNIPFEGQVALDVDYIRTRSFWCDVRLLIKTVPAVVYGRGAC